MKISGYDIMHADGGRSFSFLKITTDEGITGWSEFWGINEIHKRMGVSAVIEALLIPLKGRDPRDVERITADLYTATRQAVAGLNQQAIAAIQNALLDITAKALDVPVYRLFGGPIRTRIPLYWSHFGSNRLRAYELYDEKQITTLDEFAAHGRDAKEAGYLALKTKIHYFDDKGGTAYFPCFGTEAGAPELNLEPKILNAIVDQMAALRDAVGDDFDLILDVNSNFKADGHIRIARALEDFNLRWLEVDVFDADVMADIRQRSPVPLGGAEMICTAREFKPFFTARAIDVPLIDVPWNGFIESMRIASLADAFDINVSPHNFISHLSTMISGHFAAITPNLQVMEFDVDEVPWHGEFFTEPLPLENGHLVLTEKPGWGMDVNEEAVRERPPRVKIG